MHWHLLSLRMSKKDYFYSDRRKLSTAHICEVFVVVAVVLIIIFF